MKTQLTILSWLFAGLVHATSFDIGPNGSSYLRTYDFEQLNGTELDGQTLRFDLNFNTSVHLFRGTNASFIIGLSFQTNGTTNIGFISGSGYVLDALGQPMCAIRPLGSADSDLGQLFVGLFPLLVDKTGLLATDITRPLDFYGAHFELALPHDPGLSITEGGLSLFAIDLGRRSDQAGFRIGPHVPETGASVSLLVLAMLGLVAFNIFVIKTK